ncbi:sodium:calcium antiporter [Haloferax mediterranei ATCC 33500]|uniref:Na+/Ca2+-antiporter n=1 Tax=Haloferax mediterranei (strain ATCC 33500 / DSM 1411 / JCM 8866 / NBRC 14739 / NCIMB 2177 / R-4) TaxID=523841 RepID=I3R6M6_HALMT|nr:sodium:calcium antiporter [Haloferax mediterranei]AFK19886.1 Na+/Ca2+-antiporter [Haloferax mediterranei ATCC 33500]AHZ23265.1 sodium:calcium antiporter [Haloferax mediterranei ATCC 33500]ELZ99430.1 Na+/Ca2+-antiporter [Haloferax mediterranei ATCC 33500]MDX5987365.1 sodium:calcium antiporter [Haloferax mediterranei ATCC 33500]QCQ73873.1 sodium:calcium antiporter [Haloferax mediterranei ATCC 33500]
MVLGDFVPSSPLVNVLVVLLTPGLIWFGSGWLEESADHLATHYGLPAVVQGSIIVALGSSFPEFASVTIAAAAGVFDMGVGAIVGSAIFNILVIPALSGLASEGDLETSRLVVYKEAQFYMVAVATLVVTFSLAVIYFPEPNAPPLTGQITRPLALIPLFLYGLYLFIQWQDVSDYDGGGEGVDDGIAREWGRLLVGLLIILVGVDLLVGSVESLSRTFGVPTFLSGITIIAAATSLPDTLVSVRSATNGNSATSLGNVLGSNTFDLLVAIPVGVLIVGSVPVDFAVAVPMLGVLTLATVLLFGMLRTDLSLTRGEAYGLMLSYLVFVAWIVTETIGLTNLIQN